MGRPAKFQREEMAGAALRLVAEGGPHAVTVAAVAKEIGAPTGSIYHRYRSRDQLLAELWMDVVERFQAELVRSLAEAKDVDGAVEVAHLMASWTRAHPLEARLLLLHRRQDFIAGEWPAALVDRAAALEPQIGEALRSYSERAFGRVDRDLMMRLRYALLDAPLGALKPYVQASKPPPGVLDELAEQTVRAVLSPLTQPRS